MSFKQQARTSTVKRMTVKLGILEGAKYSTEDLKDVLSKVTFDLININLSTKKTHLGINGVGYTSIGFVNGYNPEKLDSQTVTVEYKGFKDSFNVTVSDYVKDIKLTPPTKNTYRIGETLSLTGGSITEIMASGANGKTIALTSSMVSGFESTTPGTKIITVTYTNDEESFRKTFEVAVINGTDSIEVIAPNKTEYKYGENLDITGGKVVIIKDDGSKETITVSKDEFIKLILKEISC